MMKFLHAVLCCVLLSAGIVRVVGLACHSCYHVELGPGLQSYAATLTGQISAYSQDLGTRDPVCAENQITTTHNMKSETCNATSGSTARCTLYKIQIGSDDSGKRIKAFLRRCSSYETNKVPNDGCRKETKAFFEAIPLIKRILEKSSQLLGNNIEGEVCVSSSERINVEGGNGVSASGKSQGNVLSFVLFSFFVTTVYLFN